MECVDFVITWVDGEDKEWQMEKKRYSCIDVNDDREERYRDWGILKYWFRGVERYAPWVNKIYFITWGHIPKWLNTGNPKLRIICHSDFIPEKYLPTFNSHTIELNFHRIKGLSERFVYFNDDMFIINNVSERDFFRNGIPVDMLALQPVVANKDNNVMPYIYLNNAMVIAKYFDKRENIRKHINKYFHVGYPFMYFFYNMLECLYPRFTGFYTVHGASPLLKKTYLELWYKEGELLDKCCLNKFRSKEDVSQYLLREWQKLMGNFVPVNVKKLSWYFELKEDNEKLYKVLKRHSHKMVCINDANETIDYNDIKRRLIESFETAFPDKCSYELY